MNRVLLLREEGLGSRLPVAGLWCHRAAEQRWMSFEPSAPAVEWQALGLKLAAARALKFAPACAPAADRPTSREGGLKECDAVRSGQVISFELSWGP